MCSVTASPRDNARRRAVSERALSFMKLNYGRPLSEVGVHVIFCQCFFYYKRPLSVSGVHVKICQCFYVFIYCFLWPPISPALVNGNLRKFYTWWTLSVREVITWIFSWSSLNIIVTLKCGLEVTQGHWKWYRLKASVRFPIRLKTYYFLRTINWHVDLRSL